MNMKNNDEHNELSRTLETVESKLTKLENQRKAIEHELDVKRAEIAEIKIMVEALREIDGS